MIQLISHNTRKNPLFPFVITAIVLIIIAGLITFSIYTAKGNLGDPLPVLTTKKAYTFSQLETTLFDHLELSWEDSSTVVPLYNQEEMFRGIIIIGKGESNLLAPDENTEQNISLSGAYIPMSQRAWEYIFSVGNPRETELSPSLEKTVQQYQAQQSFLYLSIDLFGYERIFTDEDPAGHYMLASTSPDPLDGESRWLRYRETDTVEYQIEGDQPIVFYDGGHSGTEAAVLHTLSLSNITVISGLLMSAIALTYVLTLHFTRSRPIFYGNRSIRHPHPLYLFLILIVYLVFDLIQTIDLLTYLYFITAGLLFVALYPYLTQEDGRRYLGMSFEHLFSSLPVGIVLAFVVTWIGSLQVPSGLNWPFDQGWLSWIWVFPLFAFLHELYWRGIIQNTLSRWTNGMLGLVLTSLLYGGYTYFQSVLLHKGSDNGLLVQSLIVAPVYALILGLFYRKTHNLWTTSVVHMLLGLFPYIVLY